jgi:hypothetical protein
MAEDIRREALASCICQKITFAYSPKVFEAEMNKPCPAHGFRRLGRVIITRIAYTRGDAPEEYGAEQALLSELVKEYKRRLAQAEQADSDQEYD